MKFFGLALKIDASTIHELLDAIGQGSISHYPLIIRGTLIAHMCWVFIQTS